MIQKNTFSSSITVILHASTLMNKMYKYSLSTSREYDTKHESFEERTSYITRTHEKINIAINMTEVFFTNLKGYSLQSIDAPFFFLLYVWRVLLTMYICGREKKPPIQNNIFGVKRKSSLEKKKDAHHFHNEHLQSKHLLSTLNHRQSHYFVFVWKHYIFISYSQHIVYVYRN